MTSDVARAVLSSLAAAALLAPWTVLAESRLDLRLKLDERLTSVATLKSRPEAVVERQLRFPRA